MSAPKASTELRAAAAPAGAPPRSGESVAARDFDRPQRLGGTTLEEIQRKLKRALPALDAALRPGLGASWSVAIEHIGEANARLELADAREPRVVAFFRLQGAPSSLRWATSAAGAAVDAVLGSSPTQGAERKLSRIETKLAGDLLLALAQATAKVLGLQLTDFELLADEAAIQMRAEDLRDSDPHRLEIDLGLGGPGGLAPLRLHLGGFRAEIAATPPAVTELPGHLDEVVLEVRARIGDSEIPLSQVVGLEQGDVIPLSALPAVAWISIEGKDFARARLGTHRGRLALRIEALVDEA